MPQITPEGLERLKRDPVAFVQTVLDITLAPWQKKVLRALGKPRKDGSKLGRPRKSVTIAGTSAGEPWKALGISERTWWRRKAEARGK